MTVFGIYLLPLTDAHPFIIVWLIGAAGITLYHLYNTLSGRAAALEVVDFEHGDPGSSVGERLEQLNRLKQQGLITESEFQDKRKKIVDQL